MKPLTVREHIAMYGTKNLSAKDLLLEIIGKGAEKRLNHILNAYEPINNEDTSEEADIMRIASMSFDELVFWGLTPIEATKLQAALAFGSKVVLEKKFCGRKHARISCPEDTAIYLMSEMRYLAVEKFVVLALNAKNEVIASTVISTGTQTGTAVSINEVFRFAIMRKSCAIIIAHNHPSGNPTPSPEDKRITEGIVATGIIMGIPCIDSVIIGDGTFFSFQAEGCLFNKF